MGGKARSQVRLDEGPRVELDLDDVAAEHARAAVTVSELAL
jgi:hypothetical protein